LDLPHGVAVFLNYAGLEVLALAGADLDRQVELLLPLYIF
jgi:hypothetical protein